MNWETIFLIVQHAGSDSSPYILERQGVYVPEHKVWNVNLRGPECGSKLIESIPEAKVYRTQEAADKRLLEVIAEDDVLR